MIKLTKLECLDILLRNKERWTAEYMSYIDREEKPPRSLATRYNRSEIKSALEKETYGKCAYCESHVKPVAFGDIEHIKPKSKYPYLTFEWENLTYVCQVCNVNKRDEYDEICPPINPYIEEPSNFFLALDAYIHHRPGNERGKRTERLLQLNRPSLLEGRRRSIKELKRLLKWYTRETRETERKLLLTEIETRIAKDKEYSFCLKSVFAREANPYPSA